MSRQGDECMQPPWAGPAPRPAPVAPAARTQVCELGGLGLHLLHIDLGLALHHAAPPLHAVHLVQGQVQLAAPTCRVAQAPQAVIGLDGGKQRAV